MLRFICDNCKKQEHCGCKGSSWCDCQHRATCIHQLEHQTPGRSSHGM